MESFVNPIVSQLHDDIFVGLRSRCGRGPSKSITPISLFKANANEFVKRLQTENLGEKFLAKAYSRAKLPTVISGETFNLYILKNLLGNEVVASKKVNECLKYGNDLIKDLFLNVMTSCIDLYSSSILENRNSQQIKEFIKNETIAYFDKIRAKYGFVDSVPVGGAPSKDYEAKYRALKEEYKKLKKKQGKEDSVAGLLDM